MCSEETKELLVLNLEFIYLFLNNCIRSLVWLGWVLSVVCWCLFLFFVGEQSFILQLTGPS